MPWILAESVALSRKEQQRAWNLESMESSFQQICLKHRHSNITLTRNDVGRSGNSIHLPQRGLVVVILLCFPWSSAEVPRIIKCEIVIAPRRGMFNRARSG